MALGFSGLRKPARVGTYALAGERATIWGGSSPLGFVGGRGSNGTKRFPRPHRCDNPASAWALLGFFEVSLSKDAAGGLVDQETHFVAAIIRSRRAHLVFLADQSDHCPHPKPNLPSNTADAEPLGPEGQRSVHLLGVALLDRTPTKLLTFSTSAV
jgi:hypothetical protein